MMRTLNIFEMWNCQGTSQTLTILMQKLHGCFGGLRKTTKPWSDCSILSRFAEVDASSSSPSGLFLLVPCSC
ncbi:hypothetical protein Bca4012_009629 [Brassica carinata]